MHNTEPKNLSDPIQFENENNIQLIVYFTNKQMSFFFFFLSSSIYPPHVSFTHLCRNHVMLQRAYRTTRLLSVAEPNSCTGGCGGEI